MKGHFGLFCSETFPSQTTTNIEVRAPTTILFLPKKNFHHFRRDDLRSISAASDEPHYNFSIHLVLCSITYILNEFRFYILIINT